MAFEVTILGCGSATPTSTQHPTAQLLQMAERFFLIDCGEGTQQQLRKYKLRMGKINHIFISHLHGDHYFGLVGLISSYHLMNRDRPLHVYGPPALQEVIELQLRVSNTELVYPLHFHPTTAKEKQLLFEDKRVSVYSFPLRHSMPITGFLFIEKIRERNIIREKIKQYNIPVFEISRIKKGADFTCENGDVILNSALTTPPPKPLKYAFCTDTLYGEKTAEWVKNADVLYHESTFLEVDKKRAKKTKHATAAQAGQVALGAQVRQLVLGHFSARYDDHSEFEKEAKNIFEATIAGKEGMRIIATSHGIEIQ